ncbi:MAG: OmpA family protein [Porphyromonas sp.]|nr:OmpA family protein [Porphyromonas sp.]
MKTKVLALSLASVLALSATAQEVTSYTVQEPGKDVSFKREKGNWFISLQGGGNMAFALGTDAAVANDVEFQDRLGVSAGIALGKWHNPYFGTRLMVDYNWIANPYVSADIDRTHSLNPHFDFMFNTSNYFGVYDQARVFSFIPYVGVGYMASQVSTGSQDANKKYLDEMNLNHSVSANFGFDLAFRLGERVSLTFGPAVTVTNLLHTPSKGTDLHMPNDLLAQLRLGLTFDTGKVGFDAVEPMDYALLNTLQSEVNSLRAQNAELSKRPVRCPECPEQIVAEPAKPVHMSVVNFRIDSSRVDRNQLINIYNAAEFAKANNVGLTVTGYADAQTGSADYNMQLSEKRAREVARLLTDEHGVPSSLITIDYKGASEQPYGVNAWNRVVIMQSK